MYHIVLTFNHGALAGLGATLASLVRNCMNTSELMLHFMCSRVDAIHQHRIKSLLAIQGYRGSYRFIDYDAAAAFENMKVPKLQGDFTSYGRLLIPKYVDASKVVYLDCDLIVRCDVRELYQTDVTGHLLAARHTGPVNSAYDRQLFLQSGCPENMPYFNAGVLVLNLDSWRRMSVGKQWRELMLSKGSMLKSHDQSVLNYLTRGCFKFLPAKFNRITLPHHVIPSAPPDGIYHFVGSPKPWDLAGRVIHRGYNLWREYTPYSWANQYLSPANGSRLTRGWHIRRSIVRTAGLRLRGAVAW